MILDKNGPKMTIFDPFKSPQVEGTKILTLQNLLKKSLVFNPLGYGIKLSPKGSKSRKYAILAVFQYIPI